MQGNEQQAYDRGITIFSPDGRLYQVEYAREAVKRGTASVGVRTEDGVVIAADRHARSPLIERDSIEKIHEIDSHVGVASAGHVADARQLIDVARRQSQVNRLRYDEPASVESLTKEITDYIQQYTQTGGARPFGVALLVAGIEDGEPRLFETDPSGTPYEWQAVAIGGSREDIQTFLEEEYAEGMDLEGGIELALRALASVNEDGLDATGVDIATIDVESEQFEKLAEDDIAERLEEFELGGEE
ncbi:proteasome alpha subunit [Haloarcula marismortui ATCC 43049]|uniref:Proteasome subunit alpha 2 n=2 Tax=Haloarcula marismortui (strain ATCC 43049 / DSM 3752 / JCM 8966 / VKM B-1809) TaxID=272569 RepID=PSA2_HALMA|nr:archaeal proteasome endopeptidase complex subunit alpha [Haloarcula marismortui]Q5V1D4.1 RecName: Full=Proteasome subunit alpha 2; AltName: Full=20S proteasome alpha subunit 2; AltName: Full=Proteasome core protein PsmA 2 [Haloarcula marismortui ATCC 43049]AAV46668.1 proteasome alpha subunit [Haloarcula marismortui ATCC 43049]QCP91379.1 archaeal proteasome endopeptidase complex subunit alpha [Haloarcula marismortui ATCC 43049]